MTEMTDISARVTVDGRTERVKLGEARSILDLLRELGIYPDTVLVMRTGTPVPLTETVLDEDDLRIIRVASGG